LRRRGLELGAGACLRTAWPLRALLYSVAILALSLLAAQPLRAGEAIAPFQLRTIEGDIFESKAKLTGKVTLLTVWRLDQKYSDRLLRDLVELRKEFSEKEVNIVTFICDEDDVARIKQVVSELRGDLPVLLDPDSRVWAAFGARVCPSCWFIDAELVERFAYPGHRRDFREVARANIEFLLGRIDDEERTARLDRKVAPPTSGTVSASVRYKLALKLLRSGSRDAARKQLEQAWQMEPRVAAAGVDLGLLLLEDREDEEALAILEQAAELLPDDPRAPGAKGAALVRLGSEDEGGRLLREALERDLAEPLPYYEMARLSESRGQEQDALRYYKRGFELMLERSRP
jgi:Tfp pilus assembly protein PilF